MPHSRLFYHVIWGTKNREPIIKAEIEPCLFDFIRSKALGLGGYVYALNGTEDHVHLVIHIPGTMPAAQYIGKVKGSSSRRLNESGISTDKFYWQSEYSVFTISEFMIPKLIKDVDNQKHVHLTRTSQSWLEEKR